MAKILSGVGFASASGSVAGVTYTRSGAGQVLRNRIMTPQRSSAAGRRARSAFGSIAKSWRLLSDAQRLKWHVAAQNTPQLLDGTGSEDLDGFRYYVAVNQLLLAANQARVQLPPPPGRRLLPILTVGSINIATQQLVFTVSDAFLLSSVNYLRISKPLSPGRSSFSGVSLRRTAVYVGNTAQNQWANYSAQVVELTAADVGRLVVVEAVRVVADGRPAGPVRKIVTLA
jgi:hypothetical protein